MMYTYTTEIPEDKVTAKRLGYRLPRSIVLPPYLSGNDFFVDWLDAVDHIFSTSVDSKIDVIKNIRNFWVSNPDLERKILSQEIVNQDDWSIPEQDLVLKQLNMMGLQLGTPTVMFNEMNFMNLCRFLGFYWLQKGTQTFIDFVNFCTGTQFVIRNCWTEDYVHFYGEGAEEIGTPIWEGGTWYPTTHVIFESVNPAMTDVRMLGQLFYQIANYNLVLHSINAVYNIPFTNGEGNTVVWKTGCNFLSVYNIRTQVHETPNATFGYQGQLLENPDYSHFYTLDDSNDTIQDLEDQKNLQAITDILEKIKKSLWTLGHH